MALNEDTLASEPSFSEPDAWPPPIGRQVSFHVRGLPIAQGSMRAFLIKGKPVVTANSKGLPAWRQAVNHEAQRVAAGLMTGPIAVELTFLMPKPKSAPKKKRIFATKRPDLDKLVRSVLDAITPGRSIRSTSRVSLSSYVSPADFSARSVVVASVGTMRRHGLSIAPSLAIALMFTALAASASVTRASSPGLLFTRIVSSFIP